jgi:hypothetical protein
VGVGVTVVEAHGVAASPPPGWDVRIRRHPVPAPETSHAVLHAATFPLPAERGDYGDGAVQLMGPGDVFVALVEFGSSALSTALFRSGGWPAPLVGVDFSRTSLQHPGAGQAGLQRWFTAGGRPWCLYVVVGRWEERAALAGKANALIAGLDVGDV